MQRLRGSDAYPIYAETPASPFVTLKVAIYHPARGSRAPDTAEIQQFVKSSIASVVGKTAGMRILRVPLDLHHPVWVADPHYCPDNHLFHTRLPAPGGKVELCDFISELMGKPLDPERPPWEVWLIEGLAGGGIAVAVKIHHSLADGKTTAFLIEKAHASTTEDAVPAASGQGEAIPGAPRLVAGAMFDLLKSYTVEFPKYYRHLQRARENNTDRKNDAGDVVAPFSAPFTILNAAGGSDRLYRYETFSVSRFKTLSKHFDCTINTLVLGVCAEALRRYLLALDALPEESLIIAMPMAAEEGSDLKTLLDSDIHNNHLAIATVPLYQNIADFGERLQVIKRASRTAIDHVLQSNGRRFDNFLDFMPGTFFRLFNTALARRQAKRQNLFANLSISNVKGPREPLYAAGGRLQMSELLSCGNLADSSNLNITAWSYVDNLCFSFYFRAGALPEPELLIRHVVDVIDELDTQIIDRKVKGHRT